MRERKIRGHNRRHKQIDNWRCENLELRFDLIDKYNRDYIDIIVHPWCDISIIKSRIPEPKGKTKRLMLYGLINIYDSWKAQLDRQEKPYYLKIWIFEPRFSKSQVVCAIEDKIDYYENIFFAPSNVKEFNSNNYGTLKTELDKFSWEYRLDEDCYDNTEVGEPELYASLEDYEETKKWFYQLLKKSHRTSKLEQPIDDIVEIYCFKKGNLWIGEKK